MAAAKRRRARRTPREEPKQDQVGNGDVLVEVEVPLVAEPPRLDIPGAVVTDASGHALTPEELGKANLTKEEQDRISLQAALQRAAEIEENDDRVEGQDKFAFDRRIIPAGWEYQWKTDTVLNQRDPAYQVDLQKAGWRPVPAGRHPEMMPSGWTDSYIIRGGQILMEMPRVSVEAARVRERRVALEAVKVKEDQLNSSPPKTFSRRGQTSREYGPMEIPKT